MQKAGLREQLSTPALEAWEPAAVEKKLSTGGASGTLEENNRLCRASDTSSYSHSIVAGGFELMS